MTIRSKRERCVGGTSLAVFPEGARTFTGQALACGFHRFGNGATTRFVYENETGFGTGITHEGNFAQRGFHHPLELTAEEAREEENVESSLVVGYKNVALAPLQVFASFDFDGEEE